ncbi:MAG: EcsC family protein [Verrucomicrobiota bacterium]|jgi:hypothetical protein
MNEPFTADELRDLRRAKLLLENRSFALKLSDLFGLPINAGFALLPKRWSRKINRAAQAALFKALEVAVATTGKKVGKSPSNRWHKVLAGASGGVGGAFGLAGLAVELPISTTLMLRSIVQIARSEGHDMRDWATKTACLEVFALGGAKKSVDPPETPYWATRLALTQSMKEAAAHLARKGAVERTAPALARFVSALASRFGAVISEEVAAKALPIVGAVGGGVINVIFMNHFQQVARGHFIVLRLEKACGQAAVKNQYEALLA